MVANGIKKIQTAMPPICPIRPMLVSQAIKSGNIKITTAKIKNTRNRQNVLTHLPLVNCLLLRKAILPFNPSSIKILSEKQSQVAKIMPGIINNKRPAEIQRIASNATQVNPANFGQVLSNISLTVIGSFRSLTAQIIAAVAHNCKTMLAARNASDIKIKKTPSNEGLAADTPTNDVLASAATSI